MGCNASVSIRIYKSMVIILVVGAVLLAWGCFRFYRQMVTAAFIDAQCANTEDYIQTGNPRALAHHVDFLIGYYNGWSKVLVGSPVARIARRDYEQALTNAVAAFRRMSTNDLGGDPQAWLKQYGYGPTAQP